MCEFGCVNLGTKAVDVGLENSEFFFFAQCDTSAMMKLNSSGEEALFMHSYLCCLSATGLDKRHRPSPLDSASA